MKTIGVIQARIGSERLKNKMLLSLHGSPIIEWVLKRVTNAELLDDLIVAIPDSVENDLLEKYILKHNVKVFRGSENDVLKRFYEASKYLKATNVVRICGDNPLVDPLEIDNLIRFFKNNSCDYAYNHIPKDNKYPNGLGAEIVSFELLEHINKVAVDFKYREHIFTYISERPDEFEIKTFNPEEELLYCPELKFDIDTFNDYLYLHSFDYDMDINSKNLITLFKET